MSWTTANADLRRVLSDGPTDRLRHRQKCFGDVDGANKTFKTFEMRRITNFTSAVGALGVYVDNVRQTAFISDDTLVGEFTLTTAPAAGASVASTHYIQWFIDAELDQFLISATQALGFGSSAPGVPDGLQPAALKFASYYAYDKLAIRWSEMISMTYRLEDQDAKAFKTVIDGYRSLADAALKDAKSMRKDYYTRQDQAEAPLFASIAGNVSDAVPRR